MTVVRLKIKECIGYTGTRNKTEDKLQIKMSVFSQVYLIPSGGRSISWWRSRYKDVMREYGDK